MYTHTHTGREYTGCYFEWCIGIFTRNFGYCSYIRVHSAVIGSDTAGMMSSACLLPMCIYNTYEEDFSFWFFVCVFFLYLLTCGCVDVNM
jgi:hypothetical protein